MRSLVRFDKLARPRAGFHDQVDQVAGVVVQLVEIAGRQNDVADELGREGRAAAILAAFLTQAAERIIEAEACGA